MKKDFSRIHEKTRNDWETPPEVFQFLNRRYGPFSYDLSASEDNSLCETYFDLETNSLLQDWDDLEGHLWLNPPFASGLIEPFLAKCQAYRGDYSICVLLPANLDRAWFHAHVMDHAEIHFLPGRIQFLLDGNKPLTSEGKPSGNVVGSIVTIYRRPMPVRASDLRLVAPTA